MNDLTIRKLDQGRTILEQNGLPVLVTLKMRPASTAPSRVKAMLGVETEAGVAAMPFAQNTVGGGKGFTPEFRLEQN